MLKTKLRADFTSTSDPDFKVLRDELSASSISVALEKGPISNSATEIRFYFVGSFVGGDQATFDALIAAHTGTKAPILDNGNSGTSPDLDWSRGTVQRITLTASVVTFAFSDMPIGHFSLKCIQDATGGRKIVWPVNVRWPRNSPIELSSSPGDEDIVWFRNDGVNIDATYGVSFG